MAGPEFSINGGNLFYWDGNMLQDRNPVQSEAPEPLGELTRDSGKGVPIASPSSQELSLLGGGVMVSLKAPVTQSQLFYSESVGAGLP